MIEEKEYKEVVKAEKKAMKKLIIYALGILLLFFLISKVSSSISGNPAEHSYNRHCASCHGKEGEGLKDLIPPLANADWLAQNQDRLACILKNGIDEKIVVNGKTYHQAMQGIQLNDIELYNIINYINTSWGNNFELTTSEKVKEDLKKCK